MLNLLEEFRVGVGRWFEAHATADAYALVDALTLTSPAAPFATESDNDAAPPWSDDDDIPF